LYQLLFGAHSEEPVVAVLQTSGLTRRFGDRVAVDAVGLSVDAGESFALLGPNGAGKTALLKMLTTLLPPTSGAASVCGYDVVRQAAAVSGRSVTCRR
jgi:ABC-2 type transport system ATP-binding protein